MAKLTIRFVGVTMFVPTSNCVLMPDGRSPRIAKSDPSVAIGSHIPFIAIATGKHSTTRLRTFKFHYDPFHLGGPMAGDYDLYALTRERITFTGLDTTAPGLDLSKVVRVQDVSGSIKPFSSDVLSGVDSVVAARFDITGATGFGVVTPNSDPLKVGTSSQQFAEIVDVLFNFAAGNVVPKIMTVDKNNFSSEFSLFPNTDTHVLAGNIELDDLLQVSFTHPHNTPLYHFELLYDLYQLDDKAPRTVPTVGEHAEGHLGTSGHCGPPAQP